MRELWLRLNPRFAGRLATTVVVLVASGALRGRLVREPSAVALVEGIPESFMRRIRLECVGVVLLHMGLVLGLGLSPGRYLLLYALFGLNWSARQYVTHAHSPRHVLDGAHNLRAHPLYESLLLHFNWHLAHHQHPRVPWLYLPRHDAPACGRPGYLTAFPRFWRGPKPVGDSASSAGGGSRRRTEHSQRRVTGK
ncbi:fatty acid desaturase [Pyxidicoccus sp. 3LFB2]